MSEWLVGAFDTAGENLEVWLFAWNAPNLLVALIVDGIMKGVGAAVGFLPQMAIFFLFYTLIQDSGYMVRVVF